MDDDSAPYAVAGQNVTLYLSGIDPIHLAIGSVLCPTSKPVPLVTRFTAQILVFDLQSPIITGTSVSINTDCRHTRVNICRSSYSIIQSTYQLRSASFCRSMKRAAMCDKSLGKLPIARAKRYRKLIGQGAAERCYCHCGDIA